MRHRRVNNEPQYLENDLEAVVSKHIFGIMLPKVETVENLKEVDGILARLEKERGLEPDSIKLLIMIETALGVIRCFELASALRRIYSVVCSSGEEGDLQTNLNCAFPGLYYARAKILLDSKAAGIPCILDGVWTNIKDEEGLKKDCILSKELGYDGRALIYPKHISIARQVYAPSPEQLDYYRRMLQAFEQAESQGLAAVTFEGQMIDYATIKKAKTIFILARNPRFKPEPVILKGGGNEMKKIGNSLLGGFSFLLILIVFHFFSIEASAQSPKGVMKGAWHFNISADWLDPS